MTVFQSDARFWNIQRSPRARSDPEHRKVEKTVRREVSAAEVDQVRHRKQRNDHPKYVGEHRAPCVPAVRDDAKKDHHSEDYHPPDPPRGR